MDGGPYVAPNSTQSAVCWSINAIMQGGLLPNIGHGSPTRRLLRVSMRIVPRCAASPFVFHFPPEWVGNCRAEPSQRIAAPPSNPPLVTNRADDDDDIETIEETYAETVGELDRPSRPSGSTEFHFFSYNPPSLDGRRVSMAGHRVRTR